MKKALTPEEDAKTEKRRRKRKADFSRVPPPHVEPPRPDWMGDPSLLPKRPPHVQGR